MATADTRAAGGDVAARLQGRRRAATAGTSGGNTPAHVASPTHRHGEWWVGWTRRQRRGKGGRRGRRCGFLRPALPAGPRGQCVWACAPHIARRPPPLSTRAREPSRLPPNPTTTAAAAVVTPPPPRPAAAPARRHHCAHEAPSARCPRTRRMAACYDALAPRPAPSQVPCMAHLPAHTHLHARALAHHVC